MPEDFMNLLAGLRWRGPPPVAAILYGDGAAFCRPCVGCPVPRRVWRITWDCEVYMRRIIGSLMALLTLALCLVSPLVAQDAGTRRQGFWFNIGFGYGTADFNCDNCGDTSRDGGVTANLALGGTLSDRFLLGVESDGWYKEESGVHNLFGNFILVGYYYPSPSADFFLKGGVGSASYLFRNGSSIDDNGLGFMAGLGYDIPVGRKTSISPTVAFNFGTMGDHQGARSVKINWLQLGASLTLH
jgi:hypothetical protein